MADSAVCGESDLKDKTKSYYYLLLRDNCPSPSRRQPFSQKD